MASFLFNKGREGFLDGSIDWDTAAIYISLVRGTAPTSSSTFTVVDDFTTGGGTFVNATAASAGTQTLASKTVTSGTADAADVTFPSVPAGAAITGLLIYQASAPSNTTPIASSLQRVIAYLDGANYTTLPITPNGGNITIAFDNGTNKIFTL